MFHQNIQLPIIIEKVDVTQLDLNDLLNRFHMSYKNILIMTGGKNSCKHAKTLIKNNHSLKFSLHEYTDNTIEVVTSLQNLIAEKSISLIIGVGGGRVLDTAKFLASKTKNCYLAFPTIISTDALASPISILSNHGKVKSYPATVPSGVLIDSNIISSVDKHAIVSGLGDLLSNLCALKDWDLAVSKRKAKSNNFAHFLSEVAVSNILTSQINSKEFLERYINSIIMSGLAMNIAGTSRPCSGSEHLLAHALSKLGCQEPHGFVVGSTTPFCLYLHQQLTEELFSCFSGKKFSLDFVDSFIPEHDLGQFFDLAKKVRGDRYTILNEFTNLELVTKYQEFLKEWIHKEST